MLKTCGVCKQVHDFNKVCRKHYVQKRTKNSDFRSTPEWTRKSLEIRQRDKYLCQVCLTNKHGTLYEFNCNDLAVHHIIPLSADFDKRLENENLITLCRLHHKMADDDKIGMQELLSLVNNPPHTFKKNF